MHVEELKRQVVATMLEVQVSAFAHALRGVSVTAYTAPVAEKRRPLT